MAESKSAATAFCINEGSELSRFVSPLETLTKSTRSERQPGPHFSIAETVAAIHQRDDGAFEIGLNGPGPFPTRAFAMAVALLGAQSCSPEF